MRAYRVQLLIEAAGVADVAAVGVLSPQRRLGRQAVGAKDTAASPPLEHHKENRRLTSGRGQRSTQADDEKSRQKRS